MMYLIVTTTRLPRQTQTSFKAIQPASATGHCHNAQGSPRKRERNMHSESSRGGAKCGSAEYPPLIGTHITILI